MMNSLIYVRGSRKDMDSWAKMGNSGWDYNSVLPFYLKSEDFKEPVTRETGQLE